MTEAERRRAVRIGWTLAAVAVLGGGTWATWLLVGSLIVQPTQGMTVSELVARRVGWMWDHGMLWWAFGTASAMVLAMMVLRGAGVDLGGSGGKGESDGGSSAIAAGAGASMGGDGGGGGE